MTQSKLSNTSLELPVPDQDALDQCSQLTAYIKDLINRQDGSIGFDEYMSAVLYQPGLGYYSAGSRKFGQQGDFITAPEISSLFSRCLARQCEEVLKNIEGGIILELGAGSGVMAKDILLELESLEALPEQYWILEVSADLKQRQQELLKEDVPHLIERIVWLDSLPKDTFSGVIVANEVLDALPVKRFKKTSASFKEMKVGCKEGEFHWLEENVNDDLLEQLNQIENGLSNKFVENYVSEYNPDLTVWLCAFENVLKQGLMLFIDYGYSAKEFYHPERIDGTLLCHYRHRVHSDPFLYPGLQDITASVNFTHVAESAFSLGLQIKGYTTQAYFLMACGLDELTSDLMSLDIKNQTKIAQQVRLLTMPAEMGERFKVMALCKDYDRNLKGFSVMDQRGRL